MNRLLLPCLLLLSIILPRHSSAQFTIWTNSVLPLKNATYCYDQAGNTGTAGVVQDVLGATSHSWIILAPAGCTTAPTYTCLTCPQTDTIIDISFDCCGQYTIAAVAINSVNIPMAYDTAFVNISCPNTASATPSKSVICLGEQPTIVGNGAVSYTWSSSPCGNILTPSPANPVTVSPTCNSNYTMIGTTAAGCTVTATTTILVQSASVTATPSVQSMCANSPVCFTATGYPSFGASVTPGTATTGIQWFDPAGNLFSNNSVTCTPATGGAYTAVLTHTGQAGTCTVATTASVTITNSISSTASSNTTSACPGQTILLTAASIQTAGASYTWTAPGGATLIGNPVVMTHTAAGCYSVDIDYFGCPGQAQVCVAMSTLVPNLSTVGGGSICPSSCATLQAYGGSPAPAYNYTFYYFTTGGPVVIGTAGTSSVGSVIHCPPSPQASYSVIAESTTGCSGGAFLTTQEFTITPQFGTILSTACPSTQITFTTGNVGAGANYTITSSYPPTPLYAGPNDTVVHTIPGAAPYTYTLQVDSAGCKGEDIHTVFPHTLTPVLSASSPSICPNTQFTLSSTGGPAATYTFYELPGITIPSALNSSTVAHIPTTIPPVNFSVTVDSANCVGGDVFQLGLLDLSSKLSLTVSPGQYVCPNTTFTIGGNLGSNFTYSFTPPTPGTILSQTNNIATASSSTLGSAPEIFTVTVDSAGCLGHQVMPMYAFTMQPQLSVNPATVCAGMPVTLTANGGTVTNYTFLKPLIAFPFFAVVGNSATPSPTVQDNPGPTSQITYTVVTDSLGCIGTATANAYIAPGLTVTASASHTYICSGTTSTLSATGPTNAIYSWSEITGTNNPVPVPGGSSLPYATSSVVVNPTVTTQYILQAVDPAGCTGTAVVTVSINPTASLNIVVSPVSSTLCTGNTTLTASGGASYTWYPSAGLTPPVTSFSVLASPSVTTIYTVVGTNNLGCYGSATTQVKFGPQPTVNIVPTSYSVCPNYNATLTAFGAASYSWTSNTFTGTVAQQSVAGGKGTYTVLGSNGGTCVHTTVITIGEQKPLSIQVTASPNSATTCIEVNYPNKLSKPVILNASGAGSYFWQPYDPMVMTYSLGPQTTVRPGASTCYTVTGYTSTCAGSTVICINVIPQFSMAVSPPLPAICLNDSLKLSIVNVSTLAVGPVSAFTYSWSDPIPPSITSQNGGVLSPTVMAYPPMTTAYSVQVNDSRGCASIPRIVTVTVFPRPVTAVAIPTINNVPTNTVCYVGIHTGPPDVVLDLVATNKNTNLPFGVTPTYTWVSPYPSPHVSILTPPNNAQVTVSAPERTPSVAVYTVLSGYNGVPGCSEVDTVHVKVIDCRPVSSATAPIFMMADNIDTLCAMECITFMAMTHTMAGGPQSYTWTFEGGNPPTSNEQNPRVCYNLPPGNKAGYNVVLRVENPYPVSTGGSSRIIGVPSYVKVVDIPQVTVVSPGNLRSDTTVRFGTPINLKATGALSYSWTPNYNITSTSSDEVTVRPFRSTRYVVTGYNSSTCLSRDTIDVIVIEDCGAMFVPNAFSPNGDGHNEVLKVQGICLESLSFMIFNRWGEKIFETTDQSLGWDGTYKGQPLNTGVFVYRLEGKTYDGKAYSSKGNITLIR